MFALCLLSIAHIYSASAGCSYYELHDFAFPTGRCVNSTLSSNNQASSTSFHCHQALFGMKIYERHYNTLDCQGSYTEINRGFCNSPECNCANSDSGLSCNAATFSYDNIYCAQKYNQNLTIVMDHCVNNMQYFQQTGHDYLYLGVYDNSNCDGDAVSIQRECYRVDYHPIDTDTDTDTYILYTTTTLNPSSTAQQAHTVIWVQYKEAVLGGMIGTMVLATFCSVCCMMRRYKKKPRNRGAEADEQLIANDVELHKEGIKNVFVNDHVDEIDVIDVSPVVEEQKSDENDANFEQMVNQIVNQYVQDNQNRADDAQPGNVDVDDEEDTDPNQAADDVPIAAYSDYTYNELEDGQDIEISEGNEGIENAEVPDTDESHESDANPGHVSPPPPPVENNEYVD
mmetsp:Transcript_4485/g.7669  ORF Transcript_4485/g.7669 Transcript_4485/m.7669 type:complete len:399 (-) Transcript_4485:47-1243(-)